MRKLAHTTLSIALVFLAGIAPAQGVYMETDDFLSAAFSGADPVTRTLWVTEELRAPVETLLGHPFGALRVRYWQLEDRTAWILDEIGKEKPITIGITVHNDAIEMVRVLEFREIRGWEVRYPFFTDQFNGARFGGGEDRGDRMLDQQIDGITGATLSVSAVTRAAQVALYLSEQVGDRP